MDKKSKTNYVFYILIITIVGSFLTVITLKQIDNVEKIADAVYYE